MALVTAEVYPGRPQPPRRATHAPSARTRIFNSASDSRTDAATSLRAPGPEDQTALDARAALAQEKCGPDRRAPDRAPTRSDAPPSAPAAPPSAPAAQSGPAAARSLRADCDLGYLLTGVFSAPASGVFVRRPAASAGGLLASTARPLPASLSADPRPSDRRVLDLHSVLQRACLLLRDPR